MTKQEFLCKERVLCEQFWQQISMMQKMRVFKKKLFVFHVANEQKTNMLYTMALKRIGLTAGIADYCVIYEEGKVAFIEFKRSQKCKLTDAQQKFKMICDDLSIPYMTVYTPHEAINFLHSL